MKRTTGSQSELGMLYQYAVTTLLAAELSKNNQIADYVIYSSEKSAGKFDDIVARVKLKDQDDWYLLLIQVKYKLTKKLNVSDNVRGKNIDYFLSDYIQCFNKILNNSELTCRRDIPADNVRFAIFCDKGIQTPVFLRQDRTFQLNLYRYFENTNVINNILLPFGDRYWKFTCKDLESSEYQHFFDRCCLYLEQPNYNKLNRQIEKACAVSSAKDVVNYVKDYFNNDYLYRQGLVKEVFDIELQRIRFSDAVPPLISFEDVVNDGRVAIFNEIILKHDITILNCMLGFMLEPHLYSCLLQRLNAILNINIDWKTNTFRKNCIDEEIIKKFIAYSYTKKFRYWVDPPHTLQLLIIELWKCGDLALVLRAHPRLCDFERCTHLKRSYIIIDDWGDKSEEFSTSNLKIFRSLSDISNIELRDIMLKSTLVSMQGRKSVTLADLLLDDKDLMSTFSSRDLLGMTRKRTPFLKEDCFKGSNYLAFLIEDEKCEEISDRIEPYAIGHNIAIYYPPGKIDECVKILQRHPHIFQNYTRYHLRRIGEKLILIKGDPNKLHHGFVDQFGDPLFVSNDGECIPVIGKSIEPNELEYICRELRRATLPRSFFSSQETQICCLSGELDFIDNFANVDDVTNETISSQKRTFFIKINKDEKRHYWSKLCRVKYPIFDIHVKNGKWELLRFNNCKDLDRHISYDGGQYTEDEFFHEIKDEANEITIITGDAGIGKTSFLKWLCNNYTTNDYIIFYDLINLQVDQNKSESQKIDLMDFILEKNRKNLPKKYIDFVNYLWEKKRLIWVLDSFDEIRLACEKQVLTFIRKITDSGAQIIIASRTENCKILMDQFGVRLIKIEPLQQTKCFTHWKLKQKLLKNVSSELTTNPLYLNFLKIISISSQEQCNEITKFTLHEKVINLKIRHCLWRTYRILYDSEVERTVSIFERLALVAVFGNDIIQEELYWVVDNEVSDITKFGIVVRLDEDSSPIFYHRSFVDFLIARWMAKSQHINIYKNCTKHLYKQLFNENKLLMLNIFFEDIELHNAVLQMDNVKIKRIMSKDENCWGTVDQLGRTALHAAVINCTYSTNPMTSYKMLEFIIKAMSQKGHRMGKRDTITNWNWSEYVQPEIFKFACMYSIKDAIKVYLQWHRKKIEKHNYSTTIFPTKFFYILFRHSTDFVHIDMIADLVWLQNWENKKFRKFYQACLGLVSESIPFHDKDLQFEGQLKPIHLACIYGSASMIRNLIEGGADINSIDTFLYTPLHYTIMRCSLFRSETIHERSKNIDILKLVLDANAIVDPSILPLNGLTPLCLAVQIMNINVVRILLESGANIFGYCTNGDTALHLAARIGSLDIVRCLLDFKASQHMENDHGETPMDIAIKQNNKEIAYLFSEASNGVTIQDDIQREANACKNIDLMGTPLHDAVCSGNINLIEVLLKKGDNINLRNKTGFSPIHASIYKKRFEVFKFLLSKGANIEVQDKHGCTPLYLSAAHGNTIAVEMLLERGANPNIANVLGETPLYRAAKNGSINAVKLLLKKGAKINIQRFNGHTALYAAVESGNQDIVVLLLESGANTEMLDEYGMTCLGASIWFQQNKICEILLRNGANANACGKSGSTPLLQAIFKKNVDIVRLLIARGAIVNGEDFCGDTFLHVAATQGSKDIIELLLEKKVNINVLNKSGRSVLFSAAESQHIDIITLLIEKNINIDDQGGGTALLFAVCGGHLDTVKLLLSKGVVVNVCDRNGLSALHVAVETGYPAIFDLILENGALVNTYTTCKKHYTPLHSAVAKESDSMVELLINKGADVNAKNNDGPTAFHLALEIGNITIVKLLLQTSINIDYETGIQALQFAVSIGDVDILKVLLNKNVNVNNCDENDYTLLYIAAIKKRLDIIDLLLENGFVEDTAARDEIVSLGGLSNDGDIEMARLFLNKGANVNIPINGSTALHLKIAEDNVDFVKLLVENGADVNSTTEKGETPLEIAIDCENTNILEMLLEGGADVNAPTSKSVSILRLAARKGNLNAVELLLNNGGDKVDGALLLHDCAREGNINILNLLLERNIDLNIQDNLGNTALHISVIEGHADVVELLLSKHANTHIANYKYKTAFHLSICRSCKNAVESNSEEFGMKEKNRERIIWLLLANMQTINVNDEDMIQKFYQASKDEHPKVVKLLLDNGMNDNTQNHQESSSLHMAVNNNDEDVVELPLENGSDIHINGNDGLDTT